MSPGENARVSNSDRRTTDKDAPARIRRVRPADDLPLEVSFGEPITDLKVHRQDARLGWTSVLPSTSYPPILKGVN